MDETRLAIMSAEIALKNREIIGDIVKIGIPSFIAFTGLVTTYFVTVKGHKKDMTIAKLHIDNDKEKEVSQRKVQLIKDISIGISKLHSSAMAYAAKLAAKLDLAKKGIPLPAEELECVSISYQDFLSEIHNNFNNESNIYLLGNQVIIDKFRDCHFGVTNLCSAYAPYDNSINYNDLEKQRIKFKLPKRSFLNY